MGLTTGAVTRVIDRLEQAGYVRRVPDPTDRRRVIVEVVPEKVAGVQATLGRVGDASTDEIGHYSEAELAVINDFLTRMAAITREEATALRQTPEQGAAATENSAPIGGLSRARLLFRSGAHELLLRGFARHRRALPGDVRRPGPAGPAAGRRRHRPVQGWLEVGLAGATCRHVAQLDDPVGRGDRRRDQQAAGQVSRRRPSLVRVDRRRRPAPAEPRPADRRGADPPDRRRQQHPDRTTDGRPGP